MIEIAVRVSNEEKRMTKKSIHYVKDGVIELTHQDPTLVKLVAESQMEFADEPMDTLITMKMDWS